MYVLDIANCNVGSTAAPEDCAVSIGRIVDFEVTELR